MLRTISGASSVCRRNRLRSCCMEKGTCFLCTAFPDKWPAMFVRDATPIAHPVHTRKRLLVSFAVNGATSPAYAAPSVPRSRIRSGVRLAGASQEFHRHHRLGTAILAARTPACLVLIPSHAAERGLLCRKPSLQLPTFPLWNDSSGSGKHSR